MTKKTAKKKAPKKQQLKIPNTGRIDANEAVEKQAEVLRKLQESRMALEIDERAERAKLTELLKEAKLKSYVYEDDDGEMREALLPAADKEPQAKVRKLKKIEAPDAD